MLRVACVLVASLMLFVGCAKNEKPPKATPALDLQKLRNESSKLVPSHLSLDASGDISLHVDTDTDLRIVTFDPGPKFAGSRLLSVGMEKFIELAQGARFRAYVDLVGFDVKPGMYTIPAVGGQKAQASPGAGAAQALSKAYLAYYKLRTGITGSPTPSDYEQASEFDRVLVPCRLVVGVKARMGRLTCSKVADPAGKSIKLEMSWVPKR